MGNTYLKETSNTHRANDDMALSSHNNNQIKRSTKRKGSLDNQSLSKQSAEHFFDNLTQSKPTEIKENIKQTSESFKDELKGLGVNEKVNSIRARAFSTDQNDIDIDIRNVFSNHFQKMRTNNSRTSSEIITNNNIQRTESNYQGDEYELNFYRNGEEIRRSYIAKLITKKVWTPSQKEKTHNSLIIFDWDDTLLPTSFLTPNGVYDENLKLSEKDKQKLAKLEFNVLRLLSISIEKGNVYIITNAGPGWVEYSAEKYYPSITKLLSQITIISARGEYETYYPNDSRMWKIQAFLNMQKNFDSDIVTNIICLGDSFIEMEAGHTLAGQFQQAFIKTIKFRESPKPEELNKQLSLICEQFIGIYSAIKNLTIRVEKKKK